MADSIIMAVTAFLMLAGALISLIAALGLLRLPDLLSRTHSASKAGTAGSGLLLIALMLQTADTVLWIKCLVTLVFFVLTAPIAAHLLAKAALKAGEKPLDLDKRNSS
ncbi:Na+/H+ antiporter subunit G [Rhizobium sp. KVB221]|uniref:Na+/H+ antiporter subunit G n=1 Tax=Rhizobium setariae TaxID=2801340 RepID=A0A936YRG8_9HYPH|nr:monovalent cation/H(+) antiporter subunit G [Rhizobium setariae]MBL0370995.1 Na+/H+ antiporter subunit G [Rhizobium setariae]